MSFSEDQVEKALNAAPKAVREVLDDGILDLQVAKLSQEHRLHVDQIGLVASCAQNILIGLLSPTQFVTELKAVGIQEQTAATILQSLNQEMFKPIHEKLRAEKEEKPVSMPEFSVPAPSQKPTPAPTPRYEAPKPSMPVAPPEAMRPLPPEPPISALPSAPPQPPPPVFEPPPPQAPSMPLMRTMEHDVEEMKEGKAPLPFMAPPAAPTPSPVPAPRPQSAPSPAPSSTPTEQEVHDTLKQYGIDPYREPVE
jgi:hypothetical protein